MRFAKIERTDGGYFLDPRPYLAHLVEIRDQLPAGAAAFAEDPGHYDFASTKCVKDLTLANMALRDGVGRITVELQFAPNKFKHDSGLRIRYENAIVFSVNADAEGRNEFAWPDTHRLGDLQLDEIIPHEQGCSHEIAMTGGSIRVIASDLHAEWCDNGDGTAANRESDDLGA
ncbi:hypothetical protein ACIA5D_43570 [Actinoplanes sp. NPDC051513]|uniref:hypothetical protein n=1 Tax=Actinoplanes sp. NPDC051513 TaxID=3363908 RepID=UPI0037B81F03